MRYHKTPKRVANSLRKPSAGRSCVGLEVSHCWAGLQGPASSRTEADKCARELGMHSWAHNPTEFRHTCTTTCVKERSQQP